MPKSTPKKSNQASAVVLAKIKSAEFVAGDAEFQEVEYQINIHRLK